MNAAGGYAIEARGLSVSVGGKRILDDIDLRIPAGAVTAVMGPSGSGKTTLLKVFNRLVELIDGVRVEGDVRVFGRSVFEMDVYELRRMFGVVFQQPNPFPHMSIYENVAIGPKINGLTKSRRELDEIVRWALERAGLWDEVRDRLRDPPWRLSGGQQQRLCLARALALKPRILLLDEPTANIDPINTARIEEAVRRLVEREGMTAVVVTHMPHQAVRLSDYIVVLYGGRIVEEGTTAEVALNPRHEITRKLLRGEL
ncbi:MAG: phosphate ABC transporter ATP-binding protein [Fervidicoccaceae archaeon]